MALVAGLVAGVGCRVATTASVASVGVGCRLGCWRGWHLGCWIPEVVEVDGRCVADYVNFVVAADTGAQLEWGDDGAHSGGRGLPFVAVYVYIDLLLGG